MASYTCVAIGGKEAVNYLLEFKNKRGTYDLNGSGFKGDAAGGDGADRRAGQRRFHSIPVGDGGGLRYIVGPLHP